MEIIDLAYQGKSKEQTIRKLSDENGRITYTILTLKSANNLGYKMLTEDSDMQFADPNEIIQISTPEGFLSEEVDEQEKVSTKSNPLLSLLSFGSSAEAKGRE